MKHLITSFLLIFTPLIWAQKAQITNAKLNAVTVYFSSAELAHSLSANLNKGTNEIVIKNIANNIDENTIRILAPKSVTVLSAQFTTDTYTDKDNSHPKSKQIKDSIELLTLQIDKLSNQIAAEKQIVELIKENKKVLGNGTALNIAEYTKFINYSKEEMLASLDKADAYTEKQNKLRTLRYELEQHLKGDVSKEKTLSKGKIVLQVMSDTPQKADFSLSYVTPLAGWFPFYELRANDINSPLSLLYKGEIYQTTGVDWKNIKLTLSSGNPNVRNEITLLKAWFLRFGNRYSAETMEINAYRRSNTFAAAEMRVADVKDVAKEEMVEATMNDYTDVSENQLNTSFEITTPYDILSNGREYSVALKELKIKAKYEYYSAPRVDNGVYLVASIDDYSQYNLLNGEANIIFEDMYVGKTMISPNQTTESMQLTMGNDKKISIKREKIADKSETKFISSYKEQTFTYEITIKNNKKETINLKLKDQYPISTNEKIQVELLEDSKAEVNTETGILTWNTTLKAGESKKYRLSYKVKYPKSEVIENL
ncbi:hypothetical protein HMPREF9075_02470 [Capnocytophaga sp. oral taxon 332 str. F0381]|uniref:DUF4139 domain-containing protein n=1 Tax=Capnocytophaga sp. oral taxon 332 TaxID=712213 RepID=UPI0002A35E28|nr:DUF4139 domain-containing protein [Capnocytophaga sp. oral taxon 332]EKY06082.1 hypothetical protein HMPREF9075_02470 [Capnocytophaga sp. oral taxon 332 str. F0381]